MGSTSSFQKQYSVKLFTGEPGESLRFYQYITGGMTWFDYQNGTESEDRQDDVDILYVDSHNLPYWATCSTNFWKEEVVKNDGFVVCLLEIPNRLPKDVCVDVVQKFIDKELTWYACSYAIRLHQSTKKIKAVIMFSNRRIVETRAVPNRETYFKRAGRSKDNKQSGGYPKNKDFTDMYGKRYKIQKMTYTWEDLLENNLIGVSIFKSD